MNGYSVIRALLIVSLGAVHLPAMATETFVLTTIGNSITWHGPNVALEWNGQWGMAASGADADYSARLASLIQGETGRAVSLQRFNHSRLEQAERYLPPPKNAIDRARSSDAVVVELGDNAPKEAAEIPRFAARYIALLQAVKPVRGALFCTGTWWQRKDLNQALRAACAAEGGWFVDLSALWNRPELKAGASGKRGHAGVLAHPGDEGMNAISESIFAEMKRGDFFR